MAEKLKIRSGSKLQMSFDAQVGAEPNFNMVCTFYKALDESAFLVSIPMVNGQPVPSDETKKLLIRYGSGENAMILAGYVDDVIKEGIRRYWKVRRVTEQRQFFQRADERIKVALRVEYMQDTWPMNDDLQIMKEDGLTLDISNGGLAFYLKRRFEVGDVCQVTMPRVGNKPEGQLIENVIGVVCWQREAPKGSPFRLICGLQFRFVNTSEKETYAAYVANAKKKFGL